MKKLYLIFLFLFLATTTFGADMEKRKTIMIDLDGVLNTYDGKYDENKMPEIRLGAREFVEELNKDYDLILFTTRNNLKATKWLIENKMDKYFKNVTNVKIPAYIYLDDRAIKFSGDYQNTIKQIEDFQAHWINK